MDRNEAMKLMSEIKLYLTAGNPVWDLEVVAEACDMAIEALRNETNCVKCVHYTERETYTGIKGVCKMDTAHREDIISIQMAIEHWGRSSGNLTNDQIAELQREIESLHSAEPKTGEWILMPMLPVNHRYKCSICKRHHRERYDYCPSCRARMLKEDGEEE